MTTPFFPRSIAFVVALTLMPSPVVAAPMGCLTAKEALAEQTIRHGIRLRESAWRCQIMGFSQDSVAIWQRIDDAIGNQFAGDTDKRKKVFTREFGDWAELTRGVWDGRIVNYFRYRPVSRQTCSGVEAMLNEVGKGGWAAFVRQAARERNDVRMDYRICG